MCRSHAPAFSLASTTDSIATEALQVIVTGYEMRGPTAADCQWPLLFVTSMISQPRRPPPYRLGYILLQGLLSKQVP